MIIVSQDKTEIVNFENIESVWISADEEGRFTIEATADTNTTLGIYKTKERAKEVLQQIIEKYREGISTCRIGEGEWTHYKNVYEMPKE